MTGEPRTTHSGPPWRYRLKFLGIPLGFTIFTMWFTGMLLWTVWVGIATLIALYAVMVYLALFVWPQERWKER